MFDLISEFPIHKPQQGMASRSKKILNFLFGCVAKRMTELSLGTG